LISGISSLLFGLHLFLLESFVLLPARCTRSGRTKENIFVGRAIECLQSIGVFCLYFLCQVYRSDVLDYFVAVLRCSKTGNQAEEAFVNRAIVLIGTPAVCRGGIRSFVLFTH